MTLNSFYIATWSATCVAIFILVWIALFGASLSPLVAWLNKNNGADWVQAFGSIAAIIGAAGIAIGVSRSEAAARRRERESDKRDLMFGQLRALRTGLLLSQGHWNTCADYTGQQKWNKPVFDLTIHNLVQAQSMVSTVQGHLLPQGLETARALLLVNHTTVLQYLREVESELVGQEELSAASIHGALGRVGAMLTETHAYLNGSKPLHV